MPLIKPVKNINQLEIFHAYDIRGRVDQQAITPKIVRRISAAFLDLINQKEVIVGRDCRLSSPELYQALIEGALSRAADVWQLGETTTDSLYYASWQKQIAGAMVTASHNPPYYNGLKLCKAGSEPLYSDELQTLKNKLPDRLEKLKGSLHDLEIQSSYIQHLLEIVKPQSLDALRVGVDGGNGVAGLLIKELFEYLPCSLNGLYLKPDGNFPHHNADPSQLSNLKDLMHLVRKKSLDLGVAFDGDADRAIFVDDLGNLLEASTVLGLLSQWSLKHHSKSAVVYDAISSKRVPQIIERHQGIAIRSRVGAPFIKKAMKEHQAVLGGETSGHYYFKENQYIDSGALTMLVMLQIISEKQQPLSEIKHSFKPYPQSTEIQLPATINQSVLLKKIVDRYQALATIDDLDGITVAWPTKWFNVRFSNTEPIIRLNAEASTTQELASLLKEINKNIQDFMQTT